MPRRYWCIVIAAFGCLSWAYAAPAPDNRAQPEQANAATNIQRSLDSIAANHNRLAEATETGAYQSPCEDGEANNQSDLCAQWYAAKAARSAATAAWWSFFLGIVGTIGLLATLYYTRRAVNVAEAATKDADAALAIAGRNADAAAAHVRVADETARKQLRAYVGFLSLRARNFAVGQRATFEVQIKNAGQTPARNMVAMQYVEFSQGDPNLTKFGRGFDEGPYSRVTLAAGADIWTGPSMDAPLDHALYQDVLGGRTVIVFGGWVAYRDIFGKRHFSTFRHSLDPSTIQDNGYALTIACRRGNRET